MQNTRKHRDRAFAAPNYAELIRMRRSDLEYRHMSPQRKRDEQPRGTTARYDWFFDLWVAHRFARVRYGHESVRCRRSSLPNFVYAIDV